ncbi:MAG TPA: V4R domain-containing protein [Methanocella sp.]|nr:V4R domain-containing protein [Methanocella sp.]
MNGVKKVKTKPQIPIELFGTDTGIKAIDNPVLVNILSMLKNSEMPFDEIVTRSGRAKSTVSVHLTHMIDAGVIGSRVDVRDRRKKIFFIKSSYLGDLKKDYSIDDDIRDYIGRAQGGTPDMFDFYRLMFRTIRVELYQKGINIEPILSDAGFKIGQALYSGIASNELDVMLSNLSKFWSDHQLGRMYIGNIDPLTIYVYDCFECCDLPVIGRPACAFDLGMLRAIFIEHFGRDPGVQETECYTMGDSRCCFVIGIK